MGGVELEGNISCFYSYPLDICWHIPRRTLAARSWVFQILGSWIRTLLLSLMSFPFFFPVYGFPESFTQDTETFSSVKLTLLLHHLCVRYILNKCSVACRCSVI